MAFTQELEGAEHLVKVINHKIWAWRTNDRTLTDPYVHTYNRCLKDIERVRAAYYSGIVSFSQAQIIIDGSMSTLEETSAELSSILDDILVIPPPAPEPLPEPVSAFSDSDDDAPPAGRQRLRAALSRAVYGKAGGRRKKTYGALKRWIDSAKGGPGKHKEEVGEGAARYRRRLSRQFNESFRASGIRTHPAGDEQRARSRPQIRHPTFDERNEPRNPQPVESLYGDLQSQQSAGTTYDGPAGTLSHYQDSEILAGPFSRKSAAPERRPRPHPRPRTRPHRLPGQSSNIAHRAPGRSSGLEKRARRQGTLPPPLPINTHTAGKIRESTAVDGHALSSGHFGGHAEDIIEMLDEMAGLGIRVNMDRRAYGL